mmetsp:Transcript_4618/g.3882  ORF Transcript_4618/g.3882 Transcript_4618/m.3882 type:complete len:124 (-) Transcript_4618:17-388(-)
MTKIPSKTNNRSTVKQTRSIKSKHMGGGLHGYSEENYKEEDSPFGGVPDIIMEIEDSDPAPNGPYVGPVFTTKQKKYFSQMVDEKLMDHEVKMSEYFGNLQMEMIRQFIIQKDELEELIKTSV